MIGVLVDEADHLDALDPLIAALPAVAQTPVGEFVEVEPIGVSDLLPRTRRSFRYAGSTTTPPCSQDVSWIILARPLEMSAAQIQLIQDVIRDFNGGFDNNRPVQNRNIRIVLTDVPRDDDDDDSGND